MIRLPTIDPPAPFTVASPIAAGDTGREAARLQAADVLERSVGPDLSDDRFEPYDRPDPGSVLVLAGNGDQMVAYVAAASSRGRLQLDVMADQQAIAETTTGDGSDGVLETLLSAMITRATPVFHGPPDHEAAAPTLEIWGRPRQAWHESLADRLGLAPHRSLHQMRCPLPVPDQDGSVDRTRAIDPAVDAARVLTVNNRAFSAHPDQSDQRLEDFEAAFTAPSFRPDSVRILDPDPTDDRASEHPMVGFCWTKIHPERQGREALGEIYVIAVDPAYHGEGHGTGLTAAGLAHLAGLGITTGMLYVESDNEPAIATYRRLGFSVHATYTAWRPA